MATTYTHQPKRSLRTRMIAAGGVVGVLLVAGGVAGASQAASPPGQAGEPYKDMPALAPIGVRVDHYMPVPPEDLAPATASSSWGVVSIW